ncbi:nucleopolyhedrovirus P10 family protein [Streptomyces sp. NPDC008150]|uniref:nucleopolyhedrovirus P10 family protein n=1 Tax=Streptomyces sp. NPDC008150 TaxID=3364816 RepID=UPI0036E7AFD5
MTADGWTRAVRQQVGLGRLLPLGGPGDGAWITERAARGVLAHAAAEVTGVRLGTTRIAAADPDADPEPQVKAPPGALPPGPLRVTAEFAAAGTEPLPAVASRLRAALVAAASQRLGLPPVDVDLRVTELLDEPPHGTTPGPAESDHVDAAERANADAGGTHGPAPEGGEPEGGEPEGGEPDEPARVTAAALGVPGVLRPTGGLGGAGRAVHIEEQPGDGTALPRRHVRVDLAVGSGRRTLDVVREVRTAVGAALRDHPTVAVLVTAVE